MIQMTIINQNATKLNLKSERIRNNIIQQMQNKKVK